MTTPSYDLYSELTIKTKDLDTCIKQLRKTGTAYAEAERAYKVLFRTEALRLRDEGMAVGMIDKVILRIPSVAEARFKRDIAEVVYKANQDAIQSIKLQLRLLDNQIQREWQG